MKTYTKLPIPNDSSWDKKTWRYYSPSWFVMFAEGVYQLNIIGENTVATKQIVLVK